jgi:hypothetical protein
MMPPHLVITKRLVSNIVLKPILCFTWFKKNFFASAITIKQNEFYNGWRYGHYPSDLFVFGAEGKISFFLKTVP